MEACHNNGIRDDSRLQNLRWDTRKSNHADKKMHGTWQGGEASGTAKLTEESVLQVYSDDRSLQAIAHDYGVSKTTIHAIKSGQNWSWLTGAGTNG